MINEKNRSRYLNILSKIVTYFVLTLGAAIIIIPFYVIIITSVKTYRESGNTSFTWWPKEGFNFDGYYQVLFKSNGGTSVLKGFINTIWMTVPPTLIGLFISALSAYAYAKINFKGKKLFFSLQMMTMMLPSVITLTSSYVLFDLIGWIDTPFPILIPGMFGGIGLIFFLTQYLKGIPNEITEAAEIDGANHMQIFTKLIIPMSGPALFAQTIIVFISRYNAYLGPLLYLQSPELYTLQIALRFYVGLNISNWPVIMAGSVVATLPLLIIYIFAQNKIIEGVQMTSGLKA